MKTITFAGFVSEAENSVYVKHNLCRVVVGRDIYYFVSKKAAVRWIDRNAAGWGVVMVDIFELNSSIFALYMSVFAYMNAEKCRKMNDQVADVLTWADKIYSENFNSMKFRYMEYIFHELNLMLKYIAEVCQAAKQYYFVPVCSGLARRLQLIKEAFLSLFRLENRYNSINLNF